MCPVNVREIPNPSRILDIARFTFCHDQILPRDRSPLHVRRTGASPAIDAMTIDQSKRPALQHISSPTAKASTRQLHTICLASMNQETRKSGKKSGQL